jgi:5-methyltetrahydropteroyltriglutamate--homocysteine methyltransferase
VVGSLLRPPQLRRALDEIYEPGNRALSPAERQKDLSALRVAEDEAVANAVRRQAEIGLDVVTDGEFRRYHFMNSFYDAVEGFETDPTPIVFRDASGGTASLVSLRIKDRLRKIDSPAAREAAYLASITDRPFKITFPAASCHAAGAKMQATGGGARGVGDVYETPEEALEDAIAIEKELVADAIAAGARYVQFDYPLYAYLVDGAWVDALRAAGNDPDEILRLALDLDRRIVEGLPDGVTVAMHICRGNFQGKWLCDGSLEPVAEPVFNELPYDVFLVEWEDVEREGGYEPLRHVPKGGPIVVLGLVSTKSPEIESVDDVLRRFEEASRFLDVEQLAVSPQCGFAPVTIANAFEAQEIQWRKLEVVAAVADRVWGRG